VVAELEGAVKVAGATVAVEHAEEVAAPAGHQAEHPEEMRGAVA